MRADLRIRQALPKGMEYVEIEPFTYRGEISIRRSSYNTVTLKSVSQQYSGYFKPMSALIVITEAFQNSSLLGTHSPKVQGEIITRGSSSVYEERLNFTASGIAESEGYIYATALVKGFVVILNAPTIPYARSSDVIELMRSNFVPLVYKADI